MPKPQARADRAFGPLACTATGEYRNWPTLELIGPTNAGDLLPTLIEGITLDEIKTLNQAFSSLDDELLREFDKELRKVSFDSSGINETEATLVRRIFDDFVTVRSTTLMAKAYGAQGVVTKGSKPFTKQTIYKMLHNRMYLGEIVHKGQSFPGQHQAIVTQGQWDAVHALIATDGIERRRETNDRQSAPVLLRGLLYTSDGERLVPSYTKKKGKTYRYYSPIKHRRFGAWASSHGALPAVPVEELVTEQILAALSTPHIVQSVWDRMQHIRPDFTEPQVVLPMRNLASLWRELFPVEQCRLAQLLIERVVIADAGLEIIWRDQGWRDLAGELLPGTIGAELQEMEEAV